MVQPATKPPPLGTFAHFKSQSSCRRQAAGRVFAGLAGQVRMKCVATVATQLLFINNKLYGGHRPVPSVQWCGVGG